MMRRRATLPVALSLALQVAGCQRHQPGATMSETATPAASLLAPSSRYRLVVFNEDQGQTQGFRIEDAAGVVVLHPKERWSTRHRLYFLWDSSDRVWVYSGDVGTSIWEQVGAGWQQRSYAGSGLPAPAFLRRTVPKIFP